MQGCVFVSFHFWHLYCVKNNSFTLQGRKINITIIKKLLEIYISRTSIKLTPDSVLLCGRPEIMHAFFVSHFWAGLYLVRVILISIPGCRRLK